jgi:hypothetical protein
MKLDFPLLFAPTITVRPDPEVPRDCARASVRFSAKPRYPETLSSSN